MIKAQIGKKFSTITKLLIELGYNNNKGDSKIANIKDAQRYIKWEKTGKISRGKETNEIIITEIYDTPLPKIDLRVNNGATGIKSDYLQDLTDLCTILLQEQSRYQLTPNELRVLFGLIDDKEAFDLGYEVVNGVDVNLIVSQYYYTLKSLLEGQIEALQNHFKKNNINIKIEEDYFTWFYSGEENRWKERQLATPDELDLIEMIEFCSFDKFKKLKNVKGSKAVLFNDRWLRNKYNNFKSEQFNKATGKNYCRCIILSGSADLIVDRSKEEILQSLKNKYRKHSLNKILGVQRKRIDTNYIKYAPYYTDDNIDRVKNAHDKLFGAEDWNSEEIINIKKIAQEKIDLGRIEKPKTKSKPKKIDNEKATNEVEMILKYDKFLNNLDTIKETREKTNILKSLGVGSTEWIEKAIELDLIDECEMGGIKLVDNFVALIYCDVQEINELQDRIRAIATDEQLKELNKIGEFDLDLLDNRNEKENENKAHTFFDLAEAYGLFEYYEDGKKRLDKLRKKLIADYIKRIDDGEFIKTIQKHEELREIDNEDNIYINIIDAWKEYHNTTAYPPQYKQYFKDLIDDDIWN